MARNFVTIIDDIEEALAREVRRMVFHNRKIRQLPGTTFREMFNPFTGELVRKPIEPRFFDDTADSLISTSPRFTIELLKLYEDRTTKRLHPAVGLDDIEILPGPQAFEVILAGNNLTTTDGSTTNDVSLTNRKIRDIEDTHVLRILTGNNQGTYNIASITLVGNGPHIITLDNDLLVNLPSFKYNPSAGILKFDSFVDLTSVKSGDLIEDIAGATFTITAVNIQDSSLAVAPGSTIANGANSKITRIGDVLTGDDSGEDQSFMILDPSQPVPNKGTKYRQRSQLIPYTFLYFIKISSRERDDHNHIANRMMQVFNPPRGAISTVVRSDESAESNTIKDITAGEVTIFVKDASKFYAGDVVRICDNLDIGEELTIQDINQQSNSITFTTPVTKTYSHNNCPIAVSNYTVCEFERDFANHDTDNKRDKQFWIHRFTYRIEAWVDSRIPDYTTEQTFEDTGDVNFIQAALEDFDGNDLCEKTVP